AAARCAARCAAAGRRAARSGRDGGESMNAAATSVTWWRALLVVFTCVALVYGWTGRTNDVPIVQPDAYENLTAAYNLAHHGVISLDPHASEPPPSEYREPLPIAVLALYIATVRGNTSLGELVESKHAA